MASIKVFSIETLQSNLFDVTQKLNSRRTSYTSQQTKKTPDKNTIPQVYIPTESFQLLLVLLPGLPAAAGTFFIDSITFAAFHSRFGN